MTKSPILAFYLGWSDARLEAVHDYIQWVFPLREPSGANPTAPVLTDADVAAFAAEPELRQRLRGAYTRMLAFFGLRPPGPKPWLTPANHNHLRLTRILGSLRALGLEAEARELFTTLETVYRAHDAVIGARTFDFWTRAVS